MSRPQQGQCRHSVSVRKEAGASSGQAPRLAASHCVSSHFVKAHRTRLARSLDASMARSLPDSIWRSSALRPRRQEKRHKFPRQWSFRTLSLLALPPCCLLPRSEVAGCKLPSCEVQDQRSGRRPGSTGVCPSLSVVYPSLPSLSRLHQASPNQPKRPKLYRRYSTQISRNSDFD